MTAQELIAKVLELEKDSVSLNECELAKTADCGEVIGYAAFCGGEKARAALEKIQNKEGKEK